MIVNIERMDHQGRGITYCDNKITFVEYALPDEIVEIEITNRQKKYNEAKVIKYIKESSKRISPICPYYKECGGCSLLHLSYEEQLEYKKNKVVDIMKRYALIDSIKIKDIIPSKKQFNYRDKVTLKNNGKLGYYKKSTNEIININYCYLVNERINDMMKELNKKRIDLCIDEVIIRSFDDDNSSLTFSLQSLIKDTSNIDNIYEGCNIVCDNRVINKKAKGNIIAKLKNKEFIVGPTSFFQVNLEQTINLYDIILENVKKIKQPVVMDLYCGTGTIGIYISDYVKEVFGVEINKNAIIDAKENARINNTKNISFKSGDAKNIIHDQDYNANIVIVDPPRSGLDKDVIKDILKIDSEMIVYVSCDPITLARDIKLFNERYNVSEITPIDMFPNTFHVECVCVLNRR